MEKVRLDKYLSKVLGVSRSQVAQLVDKKMVRVNGAVAEKNGVWVEEGDEIKILDSANSSCGDFSQLRKARFLDEPSVLSASLASHNCKNSSTILEFASCVESVKIAESSLDSADSQNLGLKIQRIYEDSDILVLNKPPFLATHGAPSLKEPSLVEWLKAHKIQRSTISGELREGIVHRLDKQTSGALVVAKNNAAHQALSAQLADKTMGRLYLAIIDLPLKEDIEIECFLARNPKNRLKISKVDVRKIRRIAESRAKNPSLRADSQNLRGKPPCDSALFSSGGWLLRDARKSFGLPRSHSLARNDDTFLDSSLRKCSAQNDNLINSQNLPKFARYSKSKFFKLLPSKDGKKELILARLFTGRTHQIRAHLESINRHIIGDELYGYKRGKGENYRVMLHAYLLELRHPKNIIFAESNEKNKSKKPAKSFCYFWLIPKVESPLPFNHNLPNKVDSQNLGENISSLRADSQNLRGNPPCEKNIKSQSRLPRSHSLARNDENMADSANLRFIAPLFDDMQDYLAKNFDMEKVNEILRTLPARAF